jgi:hypothetical protein
MTFTPPALVARLPPTVDEPFEAKSTGHVRPWGSTWWCTASVIAPASTRTVPPSTSTSPRARMRSSESTSSPRAATAPAARPVRPPEGTTPTRAASHTFKIALTSSAVRGEAMAHGAGANTFVQSRPSSLRSAGSVETTPAPQRRSISSSTD